MAAGTAAEAEPTSLNNVIDGHAFSSNKKFIGISNDKEIKSNYYSKPNSIVASDEMKKLRAATATPKPPTTSLNDIFISVKTTKQNHDNRLELILNTWQQLAKQQVSQTSSKKKITHIRRCYRIENLCIII